MLLQRQGQIILWSDTDINAGEEWEREVHQHLESADIILLLISPDFISSDYCYSTEMERAIERHDHDDAHVIPILLRPVHWNKAAPFAKLQMVPTNAKPVTSWPNRDDAFHDVTEHIVRVLSKRPNTRPQNPPFAAALSQATEGNLVPMQPAPAGQREVLEVLDPNAVWERIQRQDVPSTWHVLNASRGSTIEVYLEGGIIGALIGFLSLVFLGSFVYFVYDVMSGVSLSSFTVSTFMYLVNTFLDSHPDLMLISAGIGALLGAGRKKSTSLKTFVLMPDGFLSFTGKAPDYIISYKGVEDIRFDSHEGILAVTTTSMTPWSGDPKNSRRRLGGRIDIRHFVEAPDLIAQRVERAYTSFQARNTLP